MSELTTMALLGISPTDALLYDDMGMPGIYVRVPKFTIGDVITGGGSGVHPAFIVNGVEVDAVYISKYQNMIQNGRAYSLPMQDPAVSLDFDAARAACEAKGLGWHLMTNAEWAAIALWCRKNGLMPKGNNAYGKDSSESAAFALPTSADGANTGRVATGSGPVTWSHNGAESGIWDLKGNVHEWVGGLRLNGGEIQVLANNNAADYRNAQTAASAQWKAMLQDGTLVAPGTASTLKTDYSAAHGEVAGGYAYQLVTTLAHQQTTDNPYGSVSFAAMAAAGGVTVPMLLKALGMYPADNGDHGGAYAQMRNNGERMAMRGGKWTFTATGGVFYHSIRYERGYAESGLGFRSAYVPLT